MDNFFEVRECMGVSVNDYGVKVLRDLIVICGVGFRKEKNKKKCGVSIFV